jgi:hypothetical protein
MASLVWVSEIFPYRKIVDELCFIKTMHTEAINHDPALTFMQSVRNKEIVRVWVHG